MAAERFRLLILTSTYPRWKGDSVPAFVHELGRRLAGKFDVLTLAPHARGTARREIMDSVEVRRFRYAPTRLECLAYEGGLLANLRQRPWTWLLLPFFFLSQTLTTVMLVRKLRPDVIHAHWLVPQGLSVALLRRFGLKVPLLTTMHGSDLYSLRGRFGRRLVRFVLANSTAVTVVSSAMQRDATRDSSSATPVTVAPMGVDLSAVFVPAVGERDVNSILFVGRLVEKKGVHSLLDAFALLHQRRPSARLRIVGDGPLMPVLMRYSEQLSCSGAVSFIGALPPVAVAAELQSCTVFVMPSMQEGFGLVLAEAMACECAVIASDLAAIDDMVTGDDIGLRFPAGDAVALAAACEKLLDAPDLCREMGRAARTAISRIDWQVCADRYSKLLARLATEKALG